MIIQSRVLLASTAVVAGLVVAAVTTEADAATVTLNSVSGVWTSTDPEAGVTGGGTNEIRWGAPSPGSGYKFEGVTNGGTFNVDQVFNAGTFTHFNQPIPAGTGLESATLEVTSNVTIENETSRNLLLSSVFNFDHWETTNGADPCADGGQNGDGVNVNGCADRVRFVTNVGATETVDIDGVPYLLELTGFVIDNNRATEFWTIEDSTNTAVITGSMTVVPVPAALPLLLTALGSLGVIGRKKMKAAAA